MWLFTDVNGKLTYVTHKEAILGRKETDIILLNDASISRRHASIMFQQKQSRESKDPTSKCIIKDLSSKYGTYIFHNNKWVKIKSEYSVKDGDKIRFGLDQHIIKMKYIPIVVVASTLEDDTKKKLQNIMNKIDGIYSYEWLKDCTHLCVYEAKVTKKVSWALASCLPIVHFEYWNNVLEAFNSNAKLPDSLEYTPKIKEDLLDREKVSLCPNKKRETLFENKTFVYFNESQLEINGTIIKKCGGKTIPYKANCTDLKFVCGPNVIVLQYPQNTSTLNIDNIISEYNSIVKALGEVKRRMVSENEIPLAVLHCSNEQYCNPEFNFSRFLHNFLSVKKQRKTASNSQILAVDTQDIEVPSLKIGKNTQDYIIEATNPESSKHDDSKASIGVDESLQTVRKSRRIDDEVETQLPIEMEHVAKKIKLDDRIKPEILEPQIVESIKEEHMMIDISSDSDEFIDIKPNKKKKLTRIDDSEDEIEEKPLSMSKQPHVEFECQHRMIPMGDGNDFVPMVRKTFQPVQFKKVEISIPSKRLTLQDMFVEW